MQWASLQSHDACHIGVKLFACWEFLHVFVICRLFYNLFFKNIFEELLYHKSVKQFDPYQA